VESDYLLLSSMIWLAIDFQHTQGPKITKQILILVKKSHINHIHKKIAKHENKQQVQVQSIILNSCYEHISDTNWIELAIHVHVQQCLMLQLLRFNVLHHEVKLLQVFWKFKLWFSLSNKHDLSNVYKFQNWQFPSFYA